MEGPPDRRATLRHSDIGADASSFASSLRQRMAEALRARKIVLVTDLLAGATGRVKLLRELGVCEVLVVTHGTGTGELPGGDVERVVVEAPPVDTVSDQIRRWIDLAEDPPTPVRQAVDRFDPAGAALCLMSSFGPDGSFCGREAWGGRPPSVAGWEDKTLADGLFDAAGVARAPSLVVAAREDELLAASTNLDAGDGTVWAADASAGLNGGSDLVRWVRSRAEAEEAAEELCRAAAHVRVVPFLDGVPCSIHGFVLRRDRAGAPGGPVVSGDDVAVFRPVEQIVLRHRGSGRFVPAGLSTYWDPAPRDREEMRAVARAVGVHLGSTTVLRGGFSVDGVLTRDGFRPTEVNPRFSGGLSTIAKGVPALPFELLQQATSSGVDLGVSAPELERALVAAADAQRFGNAYAVSRARRQPDTVGLPVTGGPDELAVAATVDGTGRSGSASAVLGTLECGPSPLGALARFVPEPEALAAGERMAPYAVAALRLADQLWDTGFGALEPAPDVR